MVNKVIQSLELSEYSAGGRERRNCRWVN